MESRLALDIISTGSLEDACKLLTDFNTQHSKAFSFGHLGDEVKQKLERNILERLCGPGSDKHYETCLQAIRILSRDKGNLSVLSSDEALLILIKHSGLQAYAEEKNVNSVTIQGGQPLVMVEALKCLSNIVFNNRGAAVTCSEKGCIEVGIVQRMKTYKDPELCFDIKFFDMRLLFLVTTFVQSTRFKIKTQLHGFTYLMEVLDLIICGKTQLDDRDVSLTCEVLKILYNIALTVDKDNLDEEEEAHCQRLVSILHDLLLINTVSKDKTEDLHQHTVNLLTNMPRTSYDELLTVDTDSDMTGDAAMQASNDLDTEYDGKNMTAIVVLLNFLENRLSEPKSCLKEKLTPVLFCLCEFCRENRTIRKYCRLKVLPPLRSDVKRLPEEGNSLRNKLVKLFTCVITEVKDLAADFCFVLCKENVARFVKYTGYGNAAGLLAQRGLMCGGKTGEYSSESDDSDTEEYSQLMPGVNPVTGRWEAPKHNPSENMSEEQKEYEAMQLVQQFEQLASGGVVQPVVVGADGRPHVIEHVQQLTQGMDVPETLDGDSD